MQVLDTPRTGKLGPYVYYTDATGERLFCRTRAIPSNPRTLAQLQIRGALTYASGFWSRQLTDAQREAWVAAALNVPSCPWLSRYGHLSGQQLEIKFNTTLLTIGAQPVMDPPQPVAFSPNPVTGFSIVNDPEAGTRLLLSVGTVTEDIMVFAQPACSAGRMKLRRAYYVGLAGPAANGQIDITALYTAKFGAPEPGKKVFIVTCQTKDGWKAQDHVFRAIVPPQAPGARLSTGAATLKTKAAPSMSNSSENPAMAAPEEGRVPQVSTHQALTSAAASSAPTSTAARSEHASSVPIAVYTRSTPDAQEVLTSWTRVRPVSISRTPRVHSLRMALSWLGRLGWGAAGS